MIFFIRLKLRGKNRNFWNMKINTEIIFTIFFQ